MKGGETDGKEETSQEGQMYGHDQGRQKVQKVRNGKRKILHNSQEKITPREV
jgi:predicted transposase YdaD